MTAPRRWVAIDFETASRDRASACALGLAVIEGDRVTERRTWLIRPPGNHFDRMNTVIHGIDADLVEHEPEFDGVWPDIEPYLSGSMLLAHNASFDAGVLRACLARYGLPVPAVGGYLCTVTMSRRVWPDLANHRLPTVCLRCGIDLDHHEAGSDAAACAHVALRCRAALGVPTLDDVVRELGLRTAHL